MTNKRSAVPNAREKHEAETNQAAWEVRALLCSLKSEQKLNFSCKEKTMGDNIKSEFTWSTAKKEKKENKKKQLQIIITIVVPILYSTYGQTE